MASVLHVAVEPFEGAHAAGDKMSDDAGDKMTPAAGNKLTDSTGDKLTNGAEDRMTDGVEDSMVDSVGDKLTVSAPDNGHAHQQEAVPDAVVGRAEAAADALFDPAAGDEADGGAFNVTLQVNPPK